MEPPAIAPVEAVTAVEGRTAVGAAGFGVGMRAEELWIVLGMIADFVVVVVTLDGEGVVEVGAGAGEGTILAQSSELVAFPSWSGDKLSQGSLPFV